MNEDRKFIEETDCFFSLRLFRWPPSLVADNPLNHVTATFSTETRPYRHYLGFRQIYLPSAIIIIMLQHVHIKAWILFNV